MRSLVHVHPPSRVIRGGVIALLLATSLAAAEPGQVAHARDIYKEYIQVRKLIGEETSSWQTEQSALTDMISVLETEAVQIEESMKELRASATTADQKRAELNQQLETARATSTAFDATITELESDLKEMTLRLPDPLRRELQPLLARLPEDASATRLGYSQRLQSVVGVLAQTDKFNADVKYASEVKPVDGENLEVQTIYLGLGAALFTDPTGRYAGFGHPAADGWKWTTVSGDDAAAVAHAIDVYLSRKSPAFVSVPLHID